MTKLDYTNLDAAIVAAIADGHIQFAQFAYQGDVRAQSHALEVQRGNPRVKPAWRFVDARLQALRKKGRIRHERGDWVLVSKGTP